MKGSKELYKQRKKEYLEAAEKLRASQASYLSNENGFNMPEKVREAALLFKPAVMSDKCLSTAQMVIESGVVSADKAFAQDAVGDVIGVITARSLMQLAKEFPDAQTLKSYADKPEGDNIIRIKAEADNIASRTKPVPRSASSRRKRRSWIRSWRLACWSRHS